MRKIASFVIGAFVCGSRAPTVSNSATLPCRATSSTAPGIVPFSTSSRSRAVIRARRSDESPTCSGLTVESEGAVCAETTMAGSSHSRTVRTMRFVLITGRLLGRSLDRDRHHAQVEARMQFEALHALAERGRLHLVVDEDPRRIVHQELLRVAVQLGALVLIRRQPRLVQQLVELGV